MSYRKIVGILNFRVQETCISHGALNRFICSTCQLIAPIVGRVLRGIISTRSFIYYNWFFVIMSVNFIEIIYIICDKFRVHGCGHLIMPLIYGYILLHIFERLSKYVKNVVVICYFVYLSNILIFV